MIYDIFLNLGIFSVYAVMFHYLWYTKSLVKGLGILFIIISFTAFISYYFTIFNSDLYPYVEFCLKLLKGLL